MPIKGFQRFFKKKFTFSQLQPTWRNNRPIWNDWSQENAIKYGYKSSTYVYACINAIAKASASVPWKVYRRNQKGIWEAIEGHPLELLIERPNSFSSRKDLMERMAINLYLGGNAYFTKVRAQGMVVELWNLPTDHISVVPSKEKFIDHYLYSHAGVKQKIEPNDLLHNMFIDPSNPYTGMAPLQAGAKAVDTDVEAINWNKIALQNRAISDGVFTFDQPITKDQWTEAREMVREQHQGADNARTPWILGAGAKWQQMSLSPTEMDFIESRRFTRSEICSIFQVPPPIVGIYDDATLANIETARKIFWLDTIIPYLEDIKSCFNLGLTPEFGKDIELSYDLSNVDAIQENYTEKLNNAKTLWTMGVPFNDINQRLELGFDEIEGGEVGYLPTSVMPAGMELETDQGGTPTNERQAASLRRNISLKGNSAEHLPSVSKGLNLKTEEHKQFYWKAVEQKRSMWYLNVTRKAAALFNKEAEQVAKLIEQGKEKEALEFIDRHEKEWRKFFAAMWTSIVEEVGTEVFSNLKGAGKFETKEEKVFNPFAAIIRAYITSTVAEKVTMVTQTTKNIIRGIIHDLRAEDATLDDIARGIKDKYKDFSRYRAYRIARTEVVGASNYASIQAAKQSEVVTRKEWVSSLDDRVRDSHSDEKGVHGEIQNLDKKFSNGLMFPAEYNADLPHETIQCRCTIAYFTD